MDTDTALIIARNLLERFNGLPGGGRYQLPDGILSSTEYQALRILAHLALPTAGDVSAALSPTAQTLPDQPPPDSAGNEPPSTASALVMTALERQVPGDADTLLCLDFGTAMSKAWATRGIGARNTIPLALAKRAGQGEGLPVVSSIYISRNGTLYFGKTAETQSLESTKSGHIRFDNLKRELSEGLENRNLDEIDLPTNINPTNLSLTKGDMIVLYLAYLTDLALVELCQHEAKRRRGLLASAPDLDLTPEERDLRFVCRRFAMPCFKADREAWMRPWMRSAILRAQLVADTLSGRWSEGLTAHEAKSALDEARKVKTLPRYLLDEIDGVKEPIAAAATRFSDELDRLADIIAKRERTIDGNGLRRHLLMVIDAGAGTTDFAVFTVLNRENQDPRFLTITPTIDMDLAAGNAVDRCLRLFLYEKNGISIETGAPYSQEDFEYLDREVLARIREIKLTLLTQGTYVGVLGPGASVRLNKQEFLQSHRMLDLERQLRDKRDSVLARLGSGYFGEMKGRRQGVFVVVTGGSGNLELFRNLARASVEINGVVFEFRPLFEPPAWVVNSGNQEFINVFAQCAVAIGGAARELPSDSGALGAAIASYPPSIPILERYQTQGL